MMKKLNCISIFFLILICISCKNEKNNGLNSNTKYELKTDSINAYNELANSDKKETFTISEYNTDNSEVENIKRPEKTIIRNLEIDTTQAFGIWTQNPDGPHADFWLTSESFYVADYDGDLFSISYCSLDEIVKIEKYDQIHHFEPDKLKFGISEYDVKLRSLIKGLDKLGIEVDSMRNTSNRLEELFLDITKKGGKKQ